MQQKDIASLKHEEIDWSARTISRKRGKTKKHKNVPTVEYQLWDRTFDLLKDCVTEGDPALKNRKGETLYKVVQKPDGKISKTDAIKNAYFRAAKAAGVGKPCKLFRKTTATLIENKFDEPLSQLFLGHSPKSVAGKSYVAPSFERLTEALQFVEKELF